MSWFAVKSLTVSVALLLPTFASASTLDQVYEGGTSNGWITITNAPAGVVEGTMPWSVGAYGFNMTDTSGQLGDITAWCLDISHYLGSGPYQTTEAPFSNSYGLDAGSVARVQSLFNANFSSLILADAAQVAGFQMALWNAIYDTDGSAATGLFSAIDGTAGAQAMADSFLLAAETYPGGHRYDMTFLESLRGSQNLVTVAPIPLSATDLLLLAGLGGLGALGRRRAV